MHLKIANGFTGKLVISDGVDEIVVSNTGNCNGLRGSWFLRICN